MQAIVRALCVALPLLGATTGAALALSLPPQPCTTVDAATDFDAGASVACPQFNPVTGTLQSAQVDVSGTMTTVLTLTNTASTTQSGTAVTVTALSISSLPGFTVPNPVLVFSRSTGSLPLGSGGTSMVIPGPLAANASLGVNTTLLAPYIGTGTFPIPLATSTASTISGSGGQLSGAGATSAAVTATVTYTYTLLP